MNKCLFDQQLAHEKQGPAFCRDSMDDRENGVVSLLVEKKNDFFNVPNKTIHTITTTQTKMNPPLHITRIPFPSAAPEVTTTHPTRSQHGLVLKAIQGWGDPEQLTDAEAARLKTLCAQWFGLDGSGQLQARVWRDAVVFCHQGPAQRGARHHRHAKGQPRRPHRPLPRQPRPPAGPGRAH
jgi:hypothetical protein